jgi:hypothetical protein
MRRNLRPLAPVAGACSRVPSCTPFGLQNTSDRLWPPDELLRQSTRAGRKLDEERQAFSSAPRRLLLVVVRIESIEPGRLLEGKGVIIVRPRVDTGDIDAFSTWAGGCPLVILASDKEDAARSRFDVAHEFGHLVMPPGCRAGPPSGGAPGAPFCRRFPPAGGCHLS